MRPVPRSPGVGQTIPGGGGYSSDQGHIEHLAERSIPERCTPDGGNGDRLAIIYEVEAGPFE
jgi:hypothetical protein